MFESRLIWKIRLMKSINYAINSVTTYFIEINPRWSFWSLEIQINHQERNALFTSRVCDIWKTPKFYQLLSRCLGDQECVGILNSGKESPSLSKSRLSTAVLRSIAQGFSLKYYKLARSNDIKIQTIKGKAVSDTISFNCCSLCIPWDQRSRSKSFLPERGEGCMSQQRCVDQHLQESTINLFLLVF